MAEGNALSRARRARQMNGFYCEVPVILIDINASSDRECQPEQSFSCLVVRLCEREQMLKDSFSSSMGRFADQDDTNEWTRRGESHL
jgi:hypothetical protein